MTTMNEKNEQEAERKKDRKKERKKERKGESKKFLKMIKGTNRNNNDESCHSLSFTFVSKARSTNYKVRNELTDTGRNALLSNHCILKWWKVKERKE